MTKELKSKPITINGVDCLEILIQDDACPKEHCCDKCIYRDYVPPFYLMATCCDVHECGYRNDTYFILKEY